MPKERPRKHAAKQLVRLSLPLICTVALGGPSLMPLYAEGFPQESDTSVSGGSESSVYTESSASDSSSSYSSSDSYSSSSSDSSDTYSSSSSDSSGSYSSTSTGGSSGTDGQDSSQSSSSPTTGIASDSALSSNTPDASPSVASGSDQSEISVNSSAASPSDTTEPTTDGVNDEPGTTGAVDDQDPSSSPMDLGAPTQYALGNNQQAEQKSYDYNAGLYSEKVNNGKPYAGVYATDALQPNAPDSGSAVDGADSTVATAATASEIGVPSIADANLSDSPTTESPAIIVGSAVGYETRKVNPDGSISYSFVDGVTARDTVYDEFKRSEITEQKQGEAQAHKKITGYDGTYVIVRLDVSKFFEEAEATQEGGTSYLHVKQEDNNTLLTATGMVNVADGLQVTGPTAEDGVTKITKGNTFTGIPQAQGTTATDQTDPTKTYTLQWEDESATSTHVIRTGSYTKEQLTDPTDNKQYLDVLVFATASNVAGADVGKTGELNGDIPVSIYVDNITDYNPDYNYDPASVDPFMTANVLGKFFDATKAAKQAVEATVIKVSKYIVKGSDLALETMVEESGGKDNKETTYWSLAKSFEKPYYDQAIDRDPNDSGSGRTVSLMSEVAVTGNLDLTGTSANDLRKRTLDVNSFDVQVANNTGQETASKVGFNLRNAWLTIADFSNTTGSEFAIGNNSVCTIDEGGRLIIDKTCQLEIEWDGSTKTPTEGEQQNGEQQQPDILGNGFLDLKKGGTVVNNGVITIEGTEGKPYAPETKEASVASEKGCGEFLVNEGATLINNGCMIIYGRLYNFGTVENNGLFDDTIDSTDPDKGTFSYHKGIQVSWKDDVTQEGIIPGGIINGRSRDGNKIVESATIINRGDIVLAPGEFINYGTIDNGASGRILECPVTEAIIPVEPTATDATEIKRVTIEEVYKTRDPNDPNPKKVEESYIFNHGSIVNRGLISTGTLTLGLVLTDVYFDKLTTPGDNPDVFILENIADGAITNYGTIPGVPTVPEPVVLPTTPSWPYVPKGPVARGSSDSPGSDASPSTTAISTPDVSEQKPAEPKGIIHRITAGDSTAKPTVEQALTKVAEASIATAGNQNVTGGDVRIVAEPKLEQIADDVYGIDSMPEVDVEALVEGDGDHNAEDVQELWWCVEVDGVKVRVMDTHGNLAPGIARVIWANDADSAQVTLAGIDLGDGMVIVIGPDTKLFLDIVWS